MSLLFVELEIDEPEDDLDDLQPNASLDLKNTIEDDSLYPSRFILVHSYWLGPEHIHYSCLNSFLSIQNCVIQLLFYKKNKLLCVLMALFIA